MLSPHSGSRVGTMFGPYELRSLIGVGGMGEVYRAYHTVKDRMVAVKLLRAELAADPAFQERFRRESRVAARLQEPHVIPVHDWGDIGGVLYIDMRLVEGTNLKDVLKQSGPLDPARVASMITQVASALDAAHADGLVHRDIKPENVLLTPNDFAYLVDFGIAHAGGDSGLTRTGAAIGSCAYMAPERFTGGRLGPQVDVYALACLLHECLTGRPPFPVGDVGRLMSAHMLSRPPRPSVTRPGLGPAFDDVIATGMAKKPAARFSSAAELARAAAAAASTTPAAAPPPPPTPAATPPPPTPGADTHPTPPPPPGTAALPPPPRGADTRRTPPPATRQFSTVYPDLSGTGYSPYAPPPHVPAKPPSRRSFGRTQMLLAGAAAGAMAVAALIAAFVASGGNDSPAGTVAAPPSPTATGSITATTSTTESTTTATTAQTTTETTTTPSPTSTASQPVASPTGTDAQGFVGSYARCDPGSVPAALVQTTKSQVVVCQTAPGTLYYRGVRLADGASIQLANAVRSSGGFDVTNPADGTRYQVRPNAVAIIQPGGQVDSEPVVQYAAQ
jgi:serine/threonine protein kinase